MNGVSGNGMNNEQGAAWVSDGAVSPESLIGKLYLRVTLRGHLV